MTCSLTAGSRDMTLWYMVLAKLSRVVEMINTASESGFHVKP